MNDQPIEQPAGGASAAETGVEPAPTSPVAIQRTRDGARLAVIGGSLLLGAVAIAAAVAGPALVRAGGDATLAVSNTNAVADLSAGMGFGHDGRGHHDGMGGMHGMRGGEQLAAAATAIGVTEADLRTALQDGKTIASVAASRGVSVATVVAAMVKAETAEWAAAVKAGTMTQAQVDDMSANLTQRVTDFVNGTFPEGPGFRRGGHHDGMGGRHGGLGANDLTVAAKALGVTESELTAALRSGKTVAQVATTEGVALQQVIDAIVASDQAEIAAAVKAGTLTQAQADRKLANLAAHVTAEVNGTFDGGPGFGPGCDDSSGTSGAL